MPTTLDALKGQLSPFDPLDVVAAAGALQLLPQNAERIVRLEALAHAAASLEPEGDRHQISAPRLRTVLNTDLYKLLGSAEDPPPDCVVEELAFVGGSFKVFPGAGESFVFIVRALITAIFQTGIIKSEGFLQEAHDAVGALLTLSDRLATSAGLRRGESPHPTGREVYIPAAPIMKSLKESVTFEAPRLTDLLQERGIGLNSIEAFTASAGEDYSGAYSIEVGPLQKRPIVRFGDKYVIACPTALLDALSHYLNVLALRHGLQREYTLAYNRAVRSTVSEGLRRIRNAVIQPPPTALTFPQNLSEVAARLDRDKVVHALVLTDSLEEYDESGLTARWNLEEVTKTIIERVNEVEKAVHEQNSEVRNLFLLVHQATGRAYSFAFPAPERGSLLHVVSAADLRTISLTDAGNPLTLWDFVEGSNAIREKGVFIQAWNTLDEFGFYRAHEYSYYAGDDAPPNLISIHPADFARPLRCKVTKELSVHAVRHFSPGYFIEVESLHRNGDIPIFVPTSEIGRIAVFAESVDVPVWILGPENSPRSMRPVYGELADAVAFWIWQAAPVIKGKLSVKGLTNLLLTIDEREEAPDARGDAPVTMKQHSESEFVLTFTSQYRALTRRADNSADRKLVRALLTGLSEIGDEALDGAVDSIAPLGLKKKLLIFNPAADPALDPTDLPPYRGVQQYEIGKVLDTVGEFLSGSTTYKLGKVPLPERVDLLNSVVGFCYDQFRTKLEGLRPDILEFAIRQHESILHHQALHKATIATRLACFGDHPELVSSFKSEIQNNAKDALSCRFLIEYCSAVTPGGNLAPTLKIFDELLALSNQIINYGMLSDSVRNDLADLSLSLLPSGRLGIKEDEYRTARDAYANAFASHELDIAPKSFRKLMQDLERPEEEPAMVTALDKAAEVEFGYTITDVSSFASVLLDMESPEHSFVTAPATDLSQLAQRKLGWSNEKVDRVLDGLLITPRGDFLRPDPPSSPSDVYPWRFNRSLSYIRRPLILRRQANGGDVIVFGRRHLVSAHENLLMLCLSGRLRAVTKEMKTFISQVTNQQGSAFNDQVADLFTGRGLIVKSKVLKVPGTSGLKNIGDLDVIVVDVRKKSIDVIECKDLSVPRTPHELRLEIENLLGSDRVRNPIIRRHTVRLAWVKQHLAEVLRMLGIKNAGRWKIEGYIVVDRPLMTPFLRDVPMRIVNFAALKVEISRRFPSPLS